jgi:hypothetical protein
VGVAQIGGKPLMELISNGVRQRRFRLVIHAQNLLSHGVRPASQKAAFSRRRPAFHAKNTGNVNSLTAKMSDQRISRGIIANSADRQDSRAERREVVGSVGAAARHNLSFAMFEDQDRRFARDARDFAILEFIGDEITEENNRFRGELLDALA